MRLRKHKYMALFTVALFMMGLFYIPVIETCVASAHGVNISFHGIEESNLSGNIEFNVNTKVISNSTIQDDWDLHYKMELTDLPDEKAVVGQKIYYGEDSSLAIDIEGTIFNPEENFTLNELKGPNGITTNFETNLNQGDYSIKLSLIRINENGEEIETLGENIKTIRVSDVIYEILSPNLSEELQPGDILFNINCRVSENIGEEVYLQHKVTVWKNEGPFAEQQVEYEEGEVWASFKTSSDGVAYFGPEEGFTLEQLPKLQGENGITTKFRTNMAIGEYRIKFELVKLTDTEKIVIEKVTERSFRVQRYPTLKSKYPEPERAGITNDDLFPQTIDGVIRYFLRLTYLLDGDLRLTGNAFNSLRSSAVHSAGGSLANIIDIDFLNKAEKIDSYMSKYVFVKDGNEAHLFIPIKPLRPQTNYQVKINDNIVHYFGGSSNKAENWSFTTMAVPTITGLSLGSVNEDYDVSKPIIIAGDYFDSASITVKFNDIYAYRVKVQNNGDNPHLQVYLPRGRDRLKPGIYNVTVMKNNNDNYSQTLYSSFSVVGTSSLPIPQDGVRVKKDSRFGDVIESVKTSSNTLLLKPNYNWNYIDLNLDELMGENVLARKIKFTGNWQNNTWLYTTSKWANIAVYKLRPSTYSYNIEDIELRLGRVEPTLIPTLKRNMINTPIKSEFIEVGGENIDFERIDVEIPYFNSDGQRIRVLRYDETYRQWFEQPFTKDLLNS
ncbi:MAG TPA: hypothetical protein VFC73_08725, partial [Syntrophomonadaceae bacterium]|nr:hypothetical protein [Syntrophomonadaceae bacterium]